MTNTDIIQDVIIQVMALNVKLDNLTEEEAKAELVKISAQALMRLEKSNV